MGKYKNLSSGRFDQGLPPDVVAVLKAHYKSGKVLQLVPSAVCDTKTELVSSDTYLGIVYRTPAE